MNPYVLEKGAGEPIVFVHGSYATPSAWKKLMESLAPTHHCIAVRLPGHGGMPDPQDFEAPSISRIAAKIRCISSCALGSALRSG